MALLNSILSSTLSRGLVEKFNPAAGNASVAQNPCRHTFGVLEVQSRGRTLRRFQIQTKFGALELRNGKPLSSSLEKWRGKSMRSSSGSGPDGRVGQFAVRRKSLLISAAYISAPGAPADPQYYPLPETSDLNEFENNIPQRENLINGGLIARLVLEEKQSLAIALLSLIFGTTCTLSMPIFSGRFFETLIGVRKQPLYGLLLKLFTVYLMEPVFTVLFVTRMIRIWEKVMKELRFQVFQRILIQKVAFFDEHKVGELTSLLSTDLNSIKDIVNENVSRDRGFRSLSEVFGTVGILFVLSPELAPVMSFLMISIAGIVALYKRTTMPVFKAHGLSMARISDLAGETFAAIRTVRSFGGERRQISMFQKQVLAYQESGNKLGLLKAANESWTRVVVYVALMALYILGGTKVKSGQLAVGRLVSFIGYTFTLTFAMQGLVNTLADLRGALAAVDRINTLVGTGKVDESLARGLELENSEDHAKFIRENSNESLSDGAGTASGQCSTVCELAWTGNVALEDVHFAYPSRPDAMVLRGISIVLKAGTVTALVGSSGSGKSTIVQLLSRFYEPTKGRITLAGEDVRKFDKSDWARAVSIVNQEPVLFAMSIGENIAYGAPFRKVSEEEIIKAAKAANAHDFIESLPEGYDTMVGERGSLLSGGQRQRVAIARALLKNAPILILDEATSSLDSVSERLVQDALDILMKGRTTLVIAHRLSTVQAAHQIVVCGHGGVLEKGTHLELLAKEGTYANLVRTQTMTFE
ncbi:hypothetical protein R1flu_000044 [Riccia fluitans]|uniref:ABC transporter B family member 28 n=1 Tax=Riccia fluitans TaxID=41844 RepID=A0ABD1Y084_9MARC